MEYGELTESEWERIKPFLPPENPPHAGRPSKSHRTIINGILWILRTGAPWRALPKDYGPWSTVVSRFHRWRKKGLWEYIFKKLQAKAQSQGHIDWKKHYVDGTIV